MTPKERICAAMRRGEVDHLPCSIYFNGNLRAGGRDCSTAVGKADLAADLGVDPFVATGMGRSMHPEVKTSTWEEQIEGEPRPILWQAWDTPAGRLTQAVRKDRACERWKSIHWCDESASSMYKPLIENSEDVERCEYLVQPRSDEDHQKWLHANRAAFELAEARGLPIVATCGQGLATIMFVMGAERAVFFAVDDPEGFERLAEMIHVAEMRNIELAARGGVDILKRFGAYEICNFYNPEIYRKVCAPRLKREVELAHSLDLPIFYRVVTGAEPLLETIAQIGFDCIEGGEPHLSQCSLEMWHQSFAGAASSWTGISTPVLLGGDSTEAVRAEVRHCVEVFGKRGFILGVTNSIRQHFKWENTLAMVDEWKKVR